MATEIFTAKVKTERTFTVFGPIYTPFNNIPGANVYWQTGKFDFDPINIPARITPGSPVLVNCELFIGFLNQVGGRFVYDGSRTLTLILEPGQTVMINEKCNPWDVWENEYNARFEKSTHEEAFWQRLEYCTWVEQSKTSYFAGNSNFDILDEQFVYDYLRRLDKMHLPKGKFTIDEGWAERRPPNGRYDKANYEINRDKFPHFERMLKDLKDAGYDPGLWFSPFITATDTKLALAHPEILTDMFEKGRLQYCMQCKEEVLRPYYRELFGKYIDMGIRKLKLDIAYFPMAQMIDMLRILSEEVRAIDNTVEIECHLPSIFAVPYCDTVRMNDVSADKPNWREITINHFEVSKRSSNGKIINLDHIGSNADAPGAKTYMEHWHLLRSFLMETKSYPVVSNLPDTLAKPVCNRFCDELREIYDQDGYRKN